MRLLEIYWKFHVDNSFNFDRDFFCDSPGKFQTRELILIICAFDICRARQMTKKTVGYTYNIKTHGVVENRSTFHETSYKLCLRELREISRHNFTTFVEFHENSSKVKKRMMTKKLNFREKYYSLTFSVNFPIVRIGPKV